MLEPTKNKLDLAPLMPLTIKSTFTLESALTSQSELSPFSECPAFFVRELTAQKHDEINQGPDSKGSERQQLDYSAAGFPNIKAVDTKDSKEPAKDEKIGRAHV